MANGSGYRLAKLLARSLLLRLLSMQCSAFSLYYTLPWGGQLTVLCSMQYGMWWEKCRVCTVRYRQPACVAVLCFVTFPCPLLVPFPLSLSHTLLLALCTFAYQFVSFVHLKLRSICSFCECCCILFSARSLSALCLAGCCMLTECVCVFVCVNAWAYHF